MRRLAVALGLLVLAAGGASAQNMLDFQSSLGPLEITPLGHASLRIEVQDMVIYVDPWSNVADFSSQPKADWVWITHEHPDHFDPAAIAAVSTETTRYLMDGRSAEGFGGEATVLANGESMQIGDITVKAVPAYNLVRKRDNGEPYHPKGAYNGYLLTVGDFVVHVGGDTECVPELGELGPVDVSFLPINLPFTMPPEETAECYRIIRPAVAVPYHQGDADPQVVADLLEGTGIEVRVLELP